ncbi:DNA protecting protein DprA [Bowdeniella nasicola]|uniref:DNA protecting protein DprA n=1 Tax=Bowdeniella nasicola TaxID=208480 RepID=A0A1Q5Q607_9ACTO|nr:DNA-processing protein DprA [Bowdeniella nasicola]OKL55129.1 DNA protecting protein DprA [Bowdeniella nasicola]
MPALPNDLSPEVRAYATWSALTESGDGAALRLISRHGPVDALDRVAHALRTWADVAPANRRADSACLATATAAAPDATAIAAIDSAALKRWAPRFERLEIDSLLATHASYGGYLITPHDDAWPTRLADLGARMPLALWCRGPRTDTLAPAPAPAPIAIVGARAASTYGLHMARELAAELAMCGHPIISGGAFGIDGAAHRGALAADGPTLAILAGGVDRFYPRAHHDLLAAIEAAGLIISEHPPGRTPSRFRFLERNRLIAALSDATVVVQAAIRSGALRTARDASELGRQVAAVPGPVTDMASSGCHEAIRSQLATLVTDACEVRELVTPIGTLDATKLSDAGGILDDLTPAQARVLDVLPPRGSLDISAIADEAALSVAEVRAALGMLTLANKATQIGHAFRRA